MHVEKTEIGELLEDIFRRLRPIAAKRSIELMLEKEDAVMAEVDATKLALAFTNLIENGIKNGTLDREATMLKLDVFLTFRIPIRIRRRRRRSRSLILLPTIRGSSSTMV